MTTIEEGTIEIFCRELFVALRQVTGERIDIQPELFAARDENDPQPVLVRSLQGVEIPIRITDEYLIRFQKKSLMTRCTQRTEFDLKKSFDGCLKCHK